MIFTLIWLLVFSLFEIYWVMRNLVNLFLWTCLLSLPNDMPFKYNEGLLVDSPAFDPCPYFSS